MSRLPLTPTYHLEKLRVVKPTELELKAAEMGLAIEYDAPGKWRATEMSGRALDVPIISAKTQEQALEYPHVNCGKSL